MIRTLAVTHKGEVLTDLPLQSIVLDNYAWIWADFAMPTEEETLLLDTYFHFHPLAIEDCMHVLQRPKLDYYEDVQFFVLHALNERTLEAEEVDLFLSKNSSSPTITRINRKWRKRGRWYKLKFIAVKAGRAGRWLLLIR